MAIVTLALEGPAPAVLGGSGFLVPPTEPLTIKASTFSSVKWPWLAAAHPDRTFLRASVGRHREEATLQRSDDELVAVALADLRTVLGPEVPDSRRHPRAALGRGTAAVCRRPPFAPGAHPRAARGARAVRGGIRRRRDPGLHRVRTGGRPGGPDPLKGPRGPRGMMDP